MSTLAPAPQRRRTVQLYRARKVIIGIATGLSLLMILLVGAAWRDDRTIDGDRGTAVAEVLSAGRLRSAISFTTTDGHVHNPKLGVLYPTNLVAGQRIKVEYAMSDPDLVRVAGRDARVAIVPVGSVIVLIWACAALAWLVESRLRGRLRGDRSVGA